MSMSRILGVSVEVNVSVDVRELRVSIVCMQYVNVHRQALELHADLKTVQKPFDTCSLQNF